MAKVVTDVELAQIAEEIVRQNTGREPSSLYTTFLETLAEAIGLHERVYVSGIGSSDADPETDKPVTYISFRATEDTSSDGGVLSGFDKDKPVAEWLGEECDASSSPEC